MKEKDYDVLIYGAGASGVAAAVSAAEDGARVLLVDDASTVGGEQVCGLIGRWRGGNEGYLMEHIHPIGRRAWGRPIFEPDDLRQVFERQLEQAGVAVLLRARPVKARAGDGRLKRAVFSAGGRQRKLSAWCFVDASQDWALARLAGCALAPGGDAVALSARVGGIDTRVPGVFDAEALSQYAEPFRMAKATEEYPAAMSYPRLTPLPRGGTAVLEASWQGVAVSDDPTGAERLCRQCALDAIGFLKANAPGYENCYLIGFAEKPLAVSPRQPLRRRPARCVLRGDGPEDVPVLLLKDAHHEPQPVPFGHFLSRDFVNLLLARPAELADDQLPLLLDAGQAAGRAAALAVAYDGCALKIEPGRAGKLLPAGERPGDDL